MGRRCFFAEGFVGGGVIDLFDLLGAMDGEGVEKLLIVEEGRP